VLFDSNFSGFMMAEDCCRDGVTARSSRSFWLVLGTSVCCVSQICIQSTYSVSLTIEYNLRLVLSPSVADLQWKYALCKTRVCGVMRSVSCMTGNLWQAVPALQYEASARATERTIMLIAACLFVCRPDWRILPD
jgi:hypothetical protein